MKHSMKFVFFLLVLIIVSCQKESKSNTNPKSEPASVKQQMTVHPVDVKDEEYGMGCITEYYKKGDSAKNLIFVETSSKTNNDWINYMNINGNREVFTSSSEDNKPSKNGYTLHLENENYTVDIDAAIGEENPEADAAEASGTLKIMDKKTKETLVVDFEGGSAC